MDCVINFAVIGCGMLARSQHIPNIAASRKAALHTCCDLSDEALAECRDKYGALNITKDYKAAINAPEVEAICIATTEKMRFDNGLNQFTFATELVMADGQAIELGDDENIRTVRVRFCIW